MFKHIYRSFKEQCSTANAVRLGKTNFLEKCGSDGVWNPYCNTNMDQGEAKVACRSVGKCFSHACDTARGALVNVTGVTTRADFLQCVGTESDFGACSSQFRSDIACAVNYLFKVTCQSE